jgi:hypothetical protein
MTARHRRREQLITCVTILVVRIWPDLWNSSANQGVERRACRRAQPGSRRLAPNRALAPRASHPDSASAWWATRRTSAAAARAASRSGGVGRFGDLGVAQPRRRACRRRRRCPPVASRSSVTGPSARRPGAWPNRSPFDVRAARRLRLACDFTDKCAPLSPAKPAKRTLPSSPGQTRPAARRTPAQESRSDGASSRTAPRAADGCRPTPPTSLRGPP